MNMKEYLEKMEEQGLYCGEKLMVEGAKLAEAIVPDATIDEILFLTREVYNSNEGYDGEPTSATLHAKNIKILVDLKRTKGISLTTEFWST